MFILWASACYTVCPWQKQTWSIELFWALNGIRTGKWIEMGLFKFWDVKYFGSGRKGRSENSSQGSIHSCLILLQGQPELAIRLLSFCVCIYLAAQNKIPEAGRLNKLTVVGWWRERNPQVASTSTLWSKMFYITWLFIRTIFTRYCRRMSSLVCSVTIRQISMGEY